MPEDPAEWYQGDIKPRDLAPNPRCPHCMSRPLFHPRHPPTDRCRAGPAHVDPFFAGLATRTDEVTRRCQTVLQTRADALNAMEAAIAILHQARHARHLSTDSTLALV
jgi:hypothetical protein